MLGFGFMRRHLDPADRLGETLFGLIMALGFTGAVRLGIDEATSRELFVAILGCNIAWGIVDGVMYVMVALFERGRIARLMERVQGMDDASAALAISEELGESLEAFTDASERETIYRTMAGGIRRTGRVHAGLRRGDVLGGVAVAMLITLMTAPVVAPFLFVEDAMIASRISNAVALTMLLALGHRWGQLTGGAPWRIGLAVMGVGVAMVGVTIALGG